MAGQRGKYVVLEGDEGAGKTEQLELLRIHLERIGIPVAVVREPGGDPFAEEMRQILKHADYVVTPMAEALAFSAARANLLTTVVEPLLAVGTWVLADRSALSTMIYQGRGHGLDSTEFRTAIAYAASVVPQRMTIPLSVSQQRQRDRGDVPDRFERLGEDFRSRINQGYREYTHYAEFRSVDGVGSRAQVEERIWSHVTQLLGEDLA
jgi:dTMP kinase